MKYDVYNQAGEKAKQVDLNSDIFGIAINEGLIHQAVVAQMSAARKVLAHTKDKSEVHGGGRKPWRQKGTGRARHGSIRSPLWKGGGVTFGPTKDRNFVKKINKKMKRKALFMCLTDRATEQDLVLLDKLEVKDNKTKEFVAVLKNLKKVLKLEKIKKKTPKGKTVEQDKKKELTPTQSSNLPVADGMSQQKSGKFDIKDYKTSVLVVIGKNTAKVSRIARNMPGIKVTGANSLNVVDVLGHKNLLITEDSLKVLEKVYLK